jgi:hypothetical protein
VKILCHPYHLGLYTMQEPSYLGKNVSVSIAFMLNIENLAFMCRVEAPKTNHLRNLVPNLEKYKVVQIFHVYEDIN